MIFFILVLLLIVFSSAQAAPANTFQRDYLSKESCNAIKGIFVILILFSHGKSYITLGGIYDDPYTALQNHLNQMIVAMFFFYSGYGMMEQIKGRGYGYVQTIATKRFPRLLMNLDIAVLLFLITNIALGKHITPSRFLLALVGWGSIGNSNWYIFDVLILYLLCFIAFLPLKWRDRKDTQLVGLTALTLLSVVFVYMLMKAGQSHWWYDTLILFSVGFWYSFFKGPLEKLLMKNDLLFSLAAGLVLVVYLFSFTRRWRGIEYYTVWALCFTALVVLFTMKIAVRSTVLRWFGEHVFSVYIIQRIPFMVFDSMPFFDQHKYMFLVISYAATIPLAIMLDTVTGKLSGLIWREKKAAAA